ncbi:MAG: hypothetical protein WEA04_03780 [Candidatus Andersenbacteria bacterium]
MFKPLLKLAATSATYYVASQLTGRNYWSGRNVRGLLLGAGLALGSIAVGVVGITILVLSLFFQLADLETFVRPALVTSGISFLIALVMLLEGLRLWRRR